MRMPRWAALATGTLVTAGLVVAAAPTAQAHPANPKATKHHAAKTIKKAIHDKGRFDRKGWDFDILDMLVKDVVTADPSSPVSVLGDKTTPLTAFLPTDFAFRKYVKEVTGTWPTTEKDAYDALSALGTDAVESLLLYHVVPGDALSKKDLVRADGSTLTTASGLTLGVTVTKAMRTDKVKKVKKWHDNKGVHKRVGWVKKRCMHTMVTLVDNDPDVDDAVVVFSHYSRPRHHYGVQVAYVVTTVLHPTDI